MSPAILDEAAVRQPRTAPETAFRRALIVFCVLAVAFVLFLRRRRSRLPPAGDADVTGPEPGGVSKEAW